MFITYLNNPYKKPTSRFDFTKTFLGTSFLAGIQAKAIESAGPWGMVATFSYYAVKAYDFMLDVVKEHEQRQGNNEKADKIENTQTTIRQITYGASVVGATYSALSKPMMVTVANQVVNYSFDFALNSAYARLPVKAQNNWLVNELFALLHIGKLVCAETAGNYFDKNEMKKEDNEQSTSQDKKQSRSSDKTETQAEFNAAKQSFESLKNAVRQTAQREITEFIQSRHKSSFRHHDGFFVEFENFETEWSFVCMLRDKYKEAGLNPSLDKILKKVEGITPPNFSFVAIDAPLDKNTNVANICDKRLRITIEVMADFIASGNKFKLSYLKPGKFFGALGRNWSYTARFATPPYLLEKGFLSNSINNLQKRVHTLQTKVNENINHRPHNGRNEQSARNRNNEQSAQNNNESPKLLMLLNAMQLLYLAWLPASANDNAPRDNREIQQIDDAQQEIQQNHAMGALEIPRELGVNRPEIMQDPTTPKYPDLLKRYGCFKRKATPAKVAHTIWLINGSKAHGPNVANGVKNQFRLWANSDSAQIGFGINEIEQKIQQTYTI